MRIIIRTIRHLLGIKRRQIAYERARSAALEETNSILSAYIALMIEDKGGVSVSAAKIGEAIGKYRARVERRGDNYLISIDRGDIDGLDQTEIRESFNAAE